MKNRRCLSDRDTDAAFRCVRMQRNGEMFGGDVKIGGDPLGDDPLLTE